MLDWKNWNTFPVWPENLTLDFTQKQRLTDGAYLGKRRKDIEDLFKLWAILGTCYTVHFLPRNVLNHIYKQ